MDSDADKREPTQTTAAGLEIPVPTREAFLRDLAKIAPPAKPEPDQQHDDDAD